MNANEVNEIINNICERIGIGINSAKDFIPIFAKYKAINNAFVCVGFLIVTIIFIVVILKLIKGFKKAEKWDKDNWMFGIVSFSIMSLICGFVSWFSMFHTIEWIVVPEAMTIQYILELMK